VTALHLIPRLIRRIRGHFADKALASKKQGIVKEYAAHFDTRNLIETGTYRGDMVNAMRHHVDRIWSIELDEGLFKKARRRFRRDRRISILRGDSGKILPEILTSVTKPCLFWLDGHYSGGITARGDEETPIRKELSQILKHPVEGHVILIDDARCFDGTHDYPTIDEIEKTVKETRPSWVFDVKDDIMRIHRPQV
jgi:hypothetical protein